ncbi:hypothetical protein ACTVH1_17420 [Gluconobacter cerinus]
MTIYPEHTLESPRERLAFFRGLFLAIVVSVPCWFAAAYGIAKLGEHL